MGRMDAPTTPSSFHPAAWARGPHAQTLWASVIRRPPRLAWRPERLELPDGDFLDLCWTGGETGPIVLLVHGLEGSIRSRYARGLLRAITSRGWRGVMMHLRNCSQEPNRLTRSYHSGETGDPGFVIDTLRRREPHAPLAAVGYSIGGNMLLKLLGERGRDAALRAAVAVSVPYDLSRACDRMERGLSRLYQAHLVRLLKRSARRKIKHLRRDLGMDIQSLRPLRTFRQFDGAVTAPMHGFESAEDYYTRASSRRWLKNIQTPTLLLHARDDPFMTPDVLPNDSELSPACRLEVSERGGHIGFVSGPPWAPRYWLERRIPEFLAQHLEH